jgi:8-oxo-dGTP pyrophosphatase MutT (NUDIX family)
MGPEGTLDAVAADRPTEPRQAATVIVLRGGAERLEVLLVRRNPAARFMGGAWVFPGGAVDREEDHRVAGVREVEEETGIALPDPGELLLFSRWITPPQLKIRFDTLFFLVAAPEGAEPRPDGGETVDARWYEPQAALDAGIELVFPTIKTLDALARFGSAAELLAWAEGREVEPIVPMVIREGEMARVVLPGEPGYRD